MELGAIVGAEVRTELGLKIGMMDIGVVAGAIIRMNVGIIVGVVVGAKLRRKLRRKLRTKINGIVAKVGRAVMAQVRPEIGAWVRAAVGPHLRRPGRLPPGRGSQGGGQRARPAFRGTPSTADLVVAQNSRGSGRGGGRRGGGAVPMGRRARGRGGCGLLLPFLALLLAFLRRRRPTHERGSSPATALCDPQVR